MLLMVPVAVTLNCCADAEPARVRKTAAVRSQKVALPTTGERRQERDEFHVQGPFYRRVTMLDLLGCCAAEEQVYHVALSCINYAK